MSQSLILWSIGVNLLYTNPNTISRSLYPPKTHLLLLPITAKHFFIRTGKQQCLRDVLLWIKTNALDVVPRPLILILSVESDCINRNSGLTDPWSSTKLSRVFMVSINNMVPIFMRHLKGDETRHHSYRSHHCYPRSWAVHQLDIKNASIHGTLSETV